MSFQDPFKELYESVDSTLFDSPLPLNPLKEEEIDWVRENWEKLEKYEGKWIAVYRKQVLSSGKNGAEVKKRAFKKIGKQTPDLYLRFLESSTCIY